MSTIYSDKHKDLKELLAMASNDEGATLLIPDLQRPYIWKPLPVIVLIDSLIRGWPFGTLLTWKVSANDDVRQLARAFWKVVDRTNEGDGEVISKKNPPAAFHMVLDGQQRVQSLLLAFGGDAWGFKMFDRDWSTDIQGIRQRGRQGQPHWSLGSLCVDLQALSREYAVTKRVMAIDFTKVLQWVVADPATGQSKLAKRASYTEVLSRTSDPENIGRFIRLSRLWSKAPEQEAIEPEEAERSAKELLVSEEVPVAEHEALARPLGSLLVALGRVKRTRVTYLELSEYSEAHGNRDGYNDAIVNIFTRLNTAGRTLTREDITFAWLKIGWNVAATQGNSASRCFEELGERLSDLDFALSTEDLVSTVSFLWSIKFNGGKLLSNNDLLRGEAIRPMAAHISENWTMVVEATTAVSELLRDRRLQYGEHYKSQSAVNILSAWYFAGLQWRKDHGLKELENDAFEKRLVEALDTFSDRWLICSQWAGRWASGFTESVTGLATRLSVFVKTLDTLGDAASASDHLHKFLETEVRSLEQDAISNGPSSMVATDRKQVRAYYTALWIWNRLDKNRWAKAKLALRENRRKQSTVEVDHVVAWALWQRKIEPLLKGTENPGEERLLAEELESAVNDLGNCLLLEKNFNISKSDKTLNTFLQDVHEFKTGKVQIAEWADALQLEMPQVDSAQTSVDDLRNAFTERAAKIRADLEEFIRGTKVRIDLEDSPSPQAPGSAEEVDQTALDASPREAFKRDPHKIEFMKGFKQRMREPPLSEKFGCWGKRGRSYSCFLSIADQSEIYFGLEWDNPYIIVPKNGGYNTDNLGTGWCVEDEEDNVWYDFGPVNLADEAQCELLSNRIVKVLETIPLSK